MKQNNHNPLELLGSLTRDDIVLYDEGSKPNDLFVNIEVINPENPQSIISSWVPIDIACMLEAERETAETTQYHNWSADYHPVIEKKCDVEDVEECKVQVVEDAKKRLQDATSAYHCIAGGEISVDVSDEDYDNTVFVTARIKYKIKLIL